MTWDLDEVAPASWLQENWAGTVTIPTGIRGQKANGSAKTVYGYTLEDGSNTSLRVTGNVTLNSGTWTGQLNPSFAAKDNGLLTGEGIYRLRADVGGNFTLAADATITVDRLGYQGQGPGCNTYGCSKGASHGGRGSPYTDAYGSAACYGDVKRPVTLGSACAGIGGGAIRLNVAGQAILNGLITANAVNTASHGYYSPAGGSVLITAGTISGTGTINADGTNGGGMGQGGGGRVALVLTEANADFENFSGEVTAYGGYRDASDCGRCGTIYYEKVADNGKGTLVLRGKGSITFKAAGNVADAALSTELNGRLISTDYDFGRVILTNGTRLGVASNMSVRVRSLVGYNPKLDTVTLQGGTLLLADGFTLTNAAIHARMLGSKIQMDDAVGGGTGTLVIGDNGILQGEKQFQLAGNLRIAEGGKATHSRNSGTDYGLRLNLEVTGDMTVEAGGLVDVTLQGLYRTIADEVGFKSTSTYAAGKNGTMGYVFGSVRRPTSLGGSGSSFWGPYSGGAMHLVVRGQLVNHGIIRSDAGEDSTSKHGILGAAGSVWIEAGELFGDGKIEANGICPFWGGTDASPGRVAVYLTKEGATFDDYTGTIEARPGANSGWGAGTVFLHTAADPEEGGRLIVDAKGATSGKLTEFNVNVHDTYTGELLITNGAMVHLSQNTTLTVGGDFKNYGTYTSVVGDVDNAAGTVVFTNAAATSHIVGQSNFAELTCQTPGKRLEFATGDDHLVSLLAGGKLTLTGTEAEPIVLRGIADAAAWRLALLDGAKAEIEHVDVAWSDASSGTVTVIAKKSEDSGHNENWNFVNIVAGETNAWTGAVGSSWANPDNWQLGRTPVATDVIVISNGENTVAMPSLAEPTEIGALDIRSGATLNLATYDLTVSNALTVAGALVASSTETLTVGGAISFAGGSFTCAQTTLVLNGSESTSVNFNNQTCYYLDLNRTGATTTFTGGFTANRVRCTVEAATTLAFASGITVTASEWRLSGGTGASPLLSIWSETEGATWNFNATGYAYVGGVSVRDSVAIGRTIYADAPSSGLGSLNQNWVFGVVSATWSGEGGDQDFNNASNWSTDTVPGANDRIIVAGEAEIKIPETGVTVRELVANTGANHLYGGPLTIGLDLDVDGSTLTLDAPTEVTGNAVVRNGGIVTHTANSTADVYRVYLNVAGDMRVENGAAVSADCKGYGCGVGPGCGIGQVYDQRGSYGAKSGSGDCYGSFREPTNSGSGCGGSWGAAPYGGGVVRLLVGGTLTVNGSITSTGANKDWYTPSGGSVWITAGRLAGTGAVNARSGNASTGGLGSGGRVAIYLTEADAHLTDFQGLVDAYTGICNDYRGKVSGTVFVHEASDPEGGGTLTLSSGYSTTGSTETDMGNQLPCPGCTFARHENDNVRIVLTGLATVLQTNDLRFADLAIESSSAWWCLQNFKLKLMTRAHRQGQGWKTTPVAGGDRGEVIWMPNALMIIIK